MTARGLVLAWVGAVLIACATQPPVGEAPQLRIRNAGPASVHSLEVRFPNTDIAFGDVPAGATSGYRPVPGGVYAYAAYRARIDGRAVDVPVIDWVGESPLPGAAYTYVVAVDPAAELPVRLERVERDR